MEKPGLEECDLLLLMSLWLYIIIDILIATNVIIMAIIVITVLL